MTAKKIAKNREKKGEIRKRGKKRKNQEGSFTLPLRLTARAGYATGRGAAPLQPQNRMNLTEKGLKLCILWFPKHTFSYEKEGCPLATTKNPISL